MISFIKKIKKLLQRFAGRSEPEERRLRTLYNRFADSPEGAHIISWRDARKLHQAIQQYAPRRVLELGTGIGAASAVIADALPVGGMLTTMEQNEKCVRIATTLIPHGLQKNMRIVRSEAYAFTVSGLPTGLYFSGYKTIPTKNGPFDFVLVDGPAGWVENGAPVKYTNGDLIMLIPHLAPGCIVYIDGRKTAVKIYLQFFADYFSLVSETPWYTLLKRTDAPARDIHSLHFSDIRV
ncbi:MAG: class I SAM-dependent methyltransferase [bacterium]|nr:class I SAM-dependent methyltransferase [bacterium]